tara:strand:+ start:4887 stop:5132 length:246 start_codon:yes stop_codon:yes gene_type:complete
MDEELENFISETLGSEAYVKTNIVVQNVENYNVIAIFPLTEEATTVALEGPDALADLGSFPDSVTPISPQGPTAPFNPGSY